MPQLKDLLKQGRAGKAMTLRQVAKDTGIDQALISKFEKGSRRPTRDQLAALTRLYGLDEENSALAWLTEKILGEIKGEKLALQALESAQRRLLGRETSDEVVPQFQKLLDEMEALKTMLAKKDQG